MKKQLLPLLLIILLPGCLNLKQKKRAAKKLGANEKIILTNKKNKKIDQEIDFILEDDLADTDPFLVKNKTNNKLTAADEIAWEKSTDYNLEQHGKKVFFEYDKTNLRPSEEKTIQENLSLIKERLSKNPDLTVLVEGHSCLISKNQEYNHMLSQERANKIAKAYQNRGIPAANIKSVGRGATEVISSVMTEEQQGQNRRVETIILDL